MARNRSRYWKLEPSEMSELKYDESKLLNWEIKCVRQPEDEARFIGVFLYKNGTPYDYESIRGVCYYHNNIGRDELQSITSFLQKRFGGKSMEKSERIFLSGSDEVYAPSEIGRLASDMESEFSAKAVISLEFEGPSQEELKDAGLPEAKLLPIPT